MPLEVFHISPSNQWEMQAQGLRRGQGLKGTPFMKSKQLQHFRNILIGNMQNIRASAVKTARSMGRDNENYPDPYDRASQEAYRGFELLMREREKGMLLEIREAIERIDQGVFGICKICGCAISEKRLRANPMTTRCIACREKEEMNHEQAPHH